MTVSDSDTLMVIPIDQGEKYLRFWRIAYLRATPSHPEPKLVFGCEERPGQYPQGRVSWFNPIKLAPGNLPLGREIILSLIAAVAAYETKIRGQQSVDAWATSIVARLLSARNTGELRKLAVRFLKMMETSE